EARPRRPKSPRCERREAGVPRMGTQGASLGAWPAPIVQAQRMPRKHPYVSRRSATPSWGLREAKKQNPGAKNAPRERDGLCEIERQNVFRWGGGQPRAAQHEEQDAMRAADAVCSLPGLRGGLGRVGEGASRCESFLCPLPIPPAEVGFIRLRPA